MALAFSDPYGGGTPDVPLGQSQLRPRETYDVDNRALHNTYSDNMRSTESLVASLANFAGAVDGVEAKDREQRRNGADRQVAVLQSELAAKTAAKGGVDGNIRTTPEPPRMSAGTATADDISPAGSTPALVSGTGTATDATLAPTSPATPATAITPPSYSSVRDLITDPIARAKADEEYGKREGETAARELVNGMTLAQRENPALADAYFREQAGLIASKTSGSHLYDSSYFNQAQAVFKEAATALSHQRNGEVVKILDESSRNEGYEKGKAAITGQAYTSQRSQRILSSPVGGLVGSVAQASGMDPNRLAAIVSVESGGKASASTGSYHGLLQLSQAEFNNTRAGRAGGSIFDPKANLEAGVEIIQRKEAAFTAEFHRPPTVTELYLMHQQGEAGLRSHAANPDQPAWQSMLDTGEGRQKGEKWAKLAISGNIPADALKRLGIPADQVTSSQFTQLWADKLGDTANGSPAVAATAPDPNKPYQVADLSGNVGKSPPPAPVPDNGDPNTPPRTLSPAAAALRSTQEQVFRSQGVTHEMIGNARIRDNNVANTIRLAKENGDLSLLDAPTPQYLTADNVNALKEARTAIVQDQIAKALNTAGNHQAPEAHQALIALGNTPGLTNEMKNTIREAHLHVDEIQQSVVRQQEAKNKGDAYTAYEKVFAEGAAPDRSKFPNTPEGEIEFRRYSDYHYAGTYVPEKTSTANLQQASADVGGNWDKTLTDLGLTQADAASPSLVNAAIAKKYGTTLSQTDRTTLAAELEKHRVAGPIGTSMAKKSVTENASRIAEGFTMNADAMKAIGARNSEMNKALHNIDGVDPVTMQQEIKGYVQKAEHFYQDNYASIYARRMAQKGASLDGTEEQEVVKAATENTNAFSKSMAAVIAATHSDPAKEGAAIPILRDPTVDFASTLQAQMKAAGTTATDIKYPGVPTGSRLLTQPSGKPVITADGSYAMKLPNGESFFFRPAYNVMQNYEQGPLSHELTDAPAPAAAPAAPVAPAAAAASPSSYPAPTQHTDVGAIVSHAADAVAKAVDVRNVGRHVQNAVDYMMKPGTPSTPEEEKARQALARKAAGPRL